MIAMKSQGDSRISTSKVWKTSTRIAAVLLALGHDDCRPERCKDIVSVNGYLIGSQGTQLTTWASHN